MFALYEDPIDPLALRRRLEHPAAGAVAVFEGVVRNHNDGREVRALRYQAYTELALREGQQIVDAARARHPLIELICVHRVGALQIGQLAVWVGVAAAHREAAFAACREVIDEVKRRVPIWKQEEYRAGGSEWLHP